MNRLLKKILLALLLLIIGLFAGFWALNRWVDPNHFKPQIEAKISQHSGYPVEIQGNLTWTLFPWLGVELNQVIVQSPTFRDSTPLATLQKAHAAVAVLPLLQKKIHINHITLSGLNLQLVTNAQGQANWTLPPSKVNPSKTPSTDAASMPLNILVENIVLKDGQLRLINRQEKADIALSDLQFSISNLAFDHPFSAKGQATLKLLPSQLSDDIDFSATFSLHMAESRLSWESLSVKQQLTLPSKTSMFLASSSKGSYLWKKDQLILDSFEQGIDKALIKGQLSIQDLSTNPSPLGKLEASDLQVGSFFIPTAKMEVSTRDKQIWLNPIMATLYQGTFEGNVALNPRQASSTLSGKLSHLQLNELLKDHPSLSEFSGILDSQFQFTMQGKDSAALQRSLKGNASLIISQGTLRGLDIPYVFSAAKAMIRNKPITKKNRSLTAFDQLIATIQVAEGKACNRDLQLLSPYFQVRGEGCYVLNQQIDYTAKAYLNEKAAEEKDVSLKNMPLAIRITGTPPDLHYTPEFSDLLGHLLQAEIQKGAQKILNKVSKELGPDLGEGAQDAIQRGLGDQLQQLPFGNIFKKNRQSNDAQP